VGDAFVADGCGPVLFEDSSFTEVEVLDVTRCETVVHTELAADSDGAVAEVVVDTGSEVIVAGVCNGCPAAELKTVKQQSESDKDN